MADQTTEEQGQEQERSRSAARNGGRFDEREPGLLQELVRKAVQTTISTISSTEEGVRTVVGAVAEKDLLNHAVASVDATRREAVAILGREIHGFLENLNVGEELAKILTSVSFEIRTEVRFVPNEDGTLRAKVRTAAGPRVVEEGELDSADDESETDAPARSTRRKAVRSLVERLAEATAATARAAAEVAADAAAEVVNDSWREQQEAKEGVIEPEIVDDDEEPASAEQ